MEGLFQGQEIHQIEALVENCVQPEEDLFFFPVRHHSPVCSFHLLRAIQSYQPNVILIEGPDNTNSLISNLIHTETHPPIALYYSFNDKSGLLNEEKQKYSCYYPFLDYSPEMVALREGDRKEIDCHFIDLPYHEILLRETHPKTDRGRSYLDERQLAHNTYYQRLSQNDRCRNFHEFWEKWFEINALNIETSKYIKQLLTYVCFSRVDYTSSELEDDVTLDRERYMASKINQFRDGTQKIMVITGAFHVPGLATLLGQSIKKLKLKKVPEDTIGVYLTPYSYQECDQLSGYASGMPHPAFYQEVWKRLQASQPFEKSGMIFTTKLSGRIRSLKASLSVADEIETYRMIKQLAVFRDKREGGVFELIDGVRSACVKGELGPSDRILEQLSILLTGNRMGRLCDDADVPPLVKDYQNKIRKFKLKNSTEQVVVLDVYKKPRHIEMSCFFHRMLYLKTGFSKKVKGPDPVKKTNLSLIRETWKYGQHPSVITRLIDISVYGGSVEEAAMGKLLEELENAPQHVEMISGRLTMACLMGLEKQFPRLLAGFEHALQQDGYFYSLARGCSNLVFLLHSSYLVSEKWETRLKELMVRLYNKTVNSIPSINRTPEEDEMEVIDCLKEIHFYTIQASLKTDPDIFVEVLIVLRDSKECNPAIEGAVSGILFGLTQMTYDEVLHRLNGYLMGTGGRFMEAARFLNGLFSCCRDIILFNEQFMDLISEKIAQLDDEQFMSILPHLRLAFSFFTPREINTIGKQISKKYQIEEKEVLEQKPITLEEIALAETIDQLAAKELEKIGLLIPKKDLS